MENFKLVREINFSPPEGGDTMRGIWLISFLITLLVQVLGNIFLKFGVLSGWEYILLVTIPLVLLHEGLHSLVFLSNGFKVKFGLGAITGGIGFWTSSPGSKLTKRQFQVLALFPQILSIACIVVLLYHSNIPEWLVRSLISFLAINLGGGASDIYLFLLLYTYPEGIYIEDTKMGCKIYQSRREDD